jgi:hypothetical protein
MACSILIGQPLAVIFRGGCDSQSEVTLGSGTSCHNQYTSDLHLDTYQIQNPSLSVALCGAFFVCERSDSNSCRLPKREQSTTLQVQTRSQRHPRVDSSAAAFSPAARHPTEPLALFTIHQKADTDAYAARQLVHHPRFGALICFDTFTTDTPQNRNYLNSEMQTPNCRLVAHALEGGGKRIEVILWKLWKDCKSLLPGLTYCSRTLFNLR